MAAAAFVAALVTLGTVLLSGPAEWLRLVAALAPAWIVAVVHARTHPNLGLGVIFAACGAFLVARMPDVRLTTHGIAMAAAVAIASVLIALYRRR